MSPNPDPLPSRLAALDAPWGPHELPSEELLLRVGPRELRFRARDGEVWMAQNETRLPGEPALPDAPANTREAPDPEWSRWATPAGERRVELRPAFPDRTLVVEPELPFRLLPGAEARVYVRVPLSIRVELAGEAGEPPPLLAETPSLAMSDTWWGDFREGELAYWLPTTARREMRPELHVRHLAVCPFRMTNRSREILEVRKLAFRVVHLSLFVDGEGRFWGDDTRVGYRGEQEGSEIDMSGRAPSEAGATRLAAAPRTPSAKGFRARTFQRLRAWPAAGWPG